MSLSRFNIYMYAIMKKVTGDVAGRVMVREERVIDLSVLANL